MFQQHQKDHRRTWDAKELKKVEQDTAELSSTNLKEDVLSKVLGPERGGRVRTFGKGVTLSKLAILSQVNSRTAQLEEGQAALKAQVAHMQNVISELQKNQNHATKERPTTPIVSPAIVNPTCNAPIKLLDWMGTGEVVAEGRWSSSDPNALVHHVPIGPGTMRVWVDVEMKHDRVNLWRPTEDMTKIDEALGSTVAWPADKVIFASSLESIN
ncbi:hypothetical protein Vadar_022434 [Vaccinium darrowii]|uniref:Uncharacterized protein n=1 Tax=Vaccinium darrowii TaxID=229202 RepID=A0ACB7XBM3_9ERIC|nr:hypothetical protein Vadar_022434 [Vaccinium darrowii]